MKSYKIENEKDEVEGETKLNKFNLNKNLSELNINNCD